MNRLQTISVELAQKMDQLQARDNKPLAIAACQYALHTSGWKDTNVDEAFSRLQRNVTLTEPELAFLRKRCEALDNDYFIKQENSETDSLISFSRARIVSALLFLHSGEYAKSVYESLVSLEDTAPLLAVLHE
ncbi:hypothetical protein SAMN05192562_10555 [Kosakonia arachidis]|uniref:Uncharacterized protein n=1 Tax=Kosakonia arachidis TaxID=551989 RepID=A0A1I7DGR2_9ENTR|nr:hypothetical protein [Kosakonia arachidis]SFU10858.1 hypothetical protein SAMN05192562_10555 [Kosakonia arachidis]